MTITKFCLVGTAQGNSSSAPTERHSTAQGLNMLPNEMTLTEVCIRRISILSLSEVDANSSYL